MAYCFKQVNYLLENRLSDKINFRIFTHVVFVLQKQTQHEVKL